MAGEMFIPSMAAAGGFEAYFQRRGCNETVWYMRVEEKPITSSISCSKANEFPPGKVVRSETTDAGSTIGERIDKGNCYLQADQFYHWSASKERLKAWIRENRRKRAQGARRDQYFYDSYRVMLPPMKRERLVNLAQHAPADTARAQDRSAQEIQEVQDRYERGLKRLEAAAAEKRERLIEENRRKLEEAIAKSEDGLLRKNPSTGGGAGPVPMAKRPAPDFFLGSERHREIERSAVEEMLNDPIVNEILAWGKAQVRTGFDEFRTIGGEEGDAIDFGPVRVRAYTPQGASVFNVLGSTYGMWDRFTRQVDIWRRDGLSGDCFLWGNSDTLGFSWAKNSDVNLCD
jgi:hypothetical protein